MRAPPGFKIAQSACPFVGVAGQSLDCCRYRLRQQPAGSRFADNAGYSPPTFTTPLVPMERATFQNLLDELLQPAQFKDYGPNGLQVEGRAQVAKIVSGVTASLALIEAAIDAGADTIFVHHGLFWRGYDGRVTGWMRKRLGLLLQHDINLFAYHLPLDAHAQWGNNAQLGLRLGLVADGRFGEQQLGFIGAPSTASYASADQLARHIESVLHRSVVVVPGRSGPLRRIAWCSGGAQSYFESAIAAGADAFISGEISEPQAHLARECGVAYLACGHHATERFGAPAIAGHLASQWGLAHQFIDIENPA
jgi:dinuclear metal center YbgI/SA1388 family protein